MRHGLIYAVMPVVVASGLFLACGSSSTRETFNAPPTATDGGGKHSENTGSGSDPAFTTEPTPCDELDCKVANCGDGPKTTLSGKVYDPAGVNPIPNVQVYIPTLEPGEELPPLANSTLSGIACETCSSVILNPMRSALTNEKGEFVLDDVPVDKNVPVVIQIGKWRRKFEIEVKNACGENTIADHKLKLPRNGSEGDMPQIAVTSGGCDALECLLRGIGIDDSEFGAGHGGSGHVHVFQGAGGQMGIGSQAISFWNDEEQLKKYDMVLLSCECDEHLENKGASDPVARASMYKYLNAGGRVFASHFQYGWFKYSPVDDFRRIATWGFSTTEPGSYDVNMGFPKGELLARWLVETGGASTVGTVNLNNVTGSISAVKAPASTWISRPSAPKYLSFNTPTFAPEDQQCGRAVFSDLHVTGTGGPPYIVGCELSSGSLSGQQKAMEFLFFDLSSCVQNDAKPPVPPTK